MTIELKPAQNINLPTKVDGAPSMPSMEVQPPFTNERFFTYSPGKTMQRVFNEFSRKVMLPSELTVQELVYGIYHGCLRSVRQTAEIIGIPSFVSYEMRKMGIEPRSRLEALTNAVKNAWTSEDFRTKIHNPESNSKRSISVTQAWKEKSSLMEGAKKAGTTQKANRDRKAAEILKGNPQDILQGYVRQGLSSPKIAQITGQTESRIAGWRIRYQVEAGTLAGKKTKGEDMATVYQTALDNDTFQSLPEKYRHILLMRAGGVFRPRTLQEVGKEFGVTRERVRQIEEKIRKVIMPKKR